MDWHAILIALALTTLAGMSTVIGSFMACFAKATNVKFLSCALGLSAGVMIYVSFMDLLPIGIKDLSTEYGAHNGMIYSLMAFFIGIAFIAFIDFLIPEDENPHESKMIEEMTNDKSHMKRTGIMMALAIGIHNFPEGLATFASALGNIEVAIPIVVAIAIHNIPEGIAVSVPIYHATGSKKKAFLYSTLSGLAEPIGALVGAIFLLPLWNSTISSLLVSFTAGIMVFISFDELLPSSEKYGHHHYAIIGVIAGMIIMATSLVLFI